MNEESIIKEMSEIFAEVLDLDELHLNPSTTADDVEEWDSLNNIQLIVAIESHFNIRFLSSEIENFKNVGEMVNNIKSKTS